MKHPNQKDLPAPQLSEEIKKMNGKSSKRLTQCIEDLNQLLGDEQDKRADSPSSDTAAD